MRKEASQEVDVSRSIRRLVLALALGATALGFSGCAVHVHDGYSYSYVEPEECTVWDGSTWIVVRHHRHFRGCGHFWIGGRWCTYREEPVVIVREPVVRERGPVVVVEAGHRCNAYCNHYYSGTAWVAVPRHVHGPGCGHVLVRGTWTVSVRR
jgi:hypothetical protein